MTSKTDIFHLGYLLWLLAHEDFQGRGVRICQKIDCQKSLSGANSCMAIHADVPALPSLPESVPDYYRNIVSVCRSQNPSERAAARDILGMFPDPIISTHSRSEANDTDMGHMELLAEGVRLGPMYCTACGERDIDLPIYHRNVCLQGDFDLCQTCFDQGMHCHDRTHLLVEMGKTDNWILPQRYHSHVAGSGKRSILNL